MILIFAFAEEHDATEPNYFNDTIFLDRWVRHQGGPATASRARNHTETGSSQTAGTITHPEHF